MNIISNILMLNFFLGRHKQYVYFEISLKSNLDCVVSIFDNEINVPLHLCRLALNGFNKCRVIDIHSFDGESSYFNALNSPLPSDDLIHAVDFLSNMARHYICGVVEGFYGRPWSLEQRRDLFRRLEKFGLNSYVYAPKDDIKHRALWRQLYVDEEIMNLRLLITSAKESNIKFYYAISPGLDIDYSSEEEIDRLKIKLDQVKSLGCDCFAVLFDDIEMTMSSTNKGQFETYAEAQASVTNKLFEYLNEPSFLFCPTEYCESRCEPDLKNSEYLLALAKYLNPKIEVLWTGPKVISRLITVDHLDQVCKIVGRRPVIWDNLFANDYDIMRRLFLGPFSGRPVAIKSRTNGFLLNPNCQYEANFTPLFTLAAWNVALNDNRQNSVQNSNRTPDDYAELLEEKRSEVKSGLDEMEESSTYNPESTLNRALEHWVTIAGINRPAIFYKATPSSPLPEEKMDAAPPGDIDGVFRAGFQSVMEKVPTPALMPESPQSLKRPTADDNIQQVVRCAARQAVNSLSCEYADVVVSLNGVHDVSSETDGRMTATIDVSPEDDGRYDAAAQFLLDYDAELTDAVSGAASIVSSTDDMIVEEAGDVDKKETNFSTTSKAMSGSSMQIDAVETSPAILPLEEKSLDASSQNGLRRSDLALLCSFFYLPFENGIVCKQTLNDLMWLNGNLFEPDDKQMPILHIEEKERRVTHIQKICKLVDNLCSKLSKCPNRSFVFDVYQHAYDLQGVLNILLSFLRWADMFRIPVKEFLNREGISSKMIRDDAPIVGKMPDDTPGEFEPWVSRCSFLTECQIWLGLEQAFDLLGGPKRPLFSHLAAMHIGAVVDPILHFRPVNSSQNRDRQLLYEFLFDNLIPRIVENWSLELEISDLADRQLLIEVLGDRFLGPFFDSKIQFCFICEKVDFSLHDGAMCDFSKDDQENGKSSTMIGYCASMFNQSESSRRRFLSKMKLKYEMEYKSRRLEHSFDPSMQDQKFNFLLKFLVESFDIEDEASFLTSSLSDSSSNLAIHHPQCPQIFKSWLSSSNYHKVPEYISKNYQSYVKLMFSPEMCQTLAPKRTLMATLAALKKIGSNSIFSRLPQNDDVTKELFIQMGFQPITDSDSTSATIPPRIVFYGRRY